MKYPALAIALSVTCLSLKAQHDHDCGCDHGDAHDVENQLSTWSEEALNLMKAAKPGMSKGIDLVTKCIAFEHYQQLKENDASRLLRYANSLQLMPAEERIDSPFLCWESGSATDVMDAFEDVRSMAVLEALEDPDLPQRVFQGRQRWTRTATNPNGNVQGVPVTITWNVVPDGTPSRGSAGNPNAPSNLISSLNTAFGAAPAGGDPVGDAPWFDMFQNAFDEWSEITGNIYIYEPNDDGLLVGGSSRGVLGTRADVRIAANDFGDGPGAVLAFNSFPNNGDMVIDSQGFNTNGSLRNALTFTNTIAHEHGHGLGLSHVCPRDQTKLMEPSISRRFRGPQLDEVITVQELYGDALERQGSNRRNNTIETAHDLGVLNSGFAATDLSISDSNDVDYFRFRVNAPRSLNITVSPEDAEPFREGPQTNCSAITSFEFYDPQTRQNLAIRVLGPNGDTVIASSNRNGLGESESLNDVQVIQSGVDYYIEITGGGENVSSSNNAQLFDLSLSLTDPSAVQLSDFRILEETCLPTNGVIDPDERVTAAVTVSNIGSASADGITVSLSGSSDLSIDGSALEDVGSLNPGESTSVLFTFSIAGQCLDTETIVFRANTTTGFVELLQDVSLGTLGNVLVQNFDGGNILSGGFSQSADSVSANWNVVSSGSSSAPNSVFSSGAPSGGGFLNPTSAFLNTPELDNITMESELRFDHSYSLVASNVTGANDRVNGGVLEISINNGPWQDWLDAGGEFTQNSYNNSSILGFGGSNPTSPIIGRSSWSGNSNGFVTTIASFPSNAVGQNVRIRWHLGTVRSNVNNGGWRIDNVILRGPVCCQSVSLLPTLSITASDPEASEFDSSDQAEFRISSDIQVSESILVAYSLSGSAVSGTDFIALAGTATIASGESVVNVPVTAISDLDIEGDQSVTLTLSPSSNYAIASGVASITIKDLPFDEFRSMAFGGATSNIGPNEDFDTDGIENLLEYAFRLNPVQQDVLPFELLVDNQQTTNPVLELTYREDTRLQDVNYIAETSTGLSEGSWTSNGVTVTRGVISDGLQSVTASIPVDSETTRFIRIRVERFSAAP